MEKVRGVALHSQFIAVGGIRKIDLLSKILCILIKLKKKIKKKHRNFYFPVSG